MCVRTYVPQRGLQCMNKIAEQVTSTLVGDNDIKAESDSDIEEDPDFPLPTLNSDVTKKRMASQ